MPSIAIRNITPQTHIALKALAAFHQRSTEAHVRILLEQAVQPPRTRDGFGTRLHNLAMQHGGFDLDFKRDSTPAMHTAATFD